MYCRILWLHSKTVDSWSPGTMSLGHVAELRAQAAYFQVRHVGLRQRRKWTWNDMDFPLNVANKIWGSIFLTTQKLGDVTMATMGVPNESDLGPLESTSLWTISIFWGLDWVSGPDVHATWGLGLGDPKRSILHARFLKEGNREPPKKPSKKCFLVLISYLQQTIWIFFGGTKLCVWLMTSQHLSHRKVWAMWAGVAWSQTLRTSVLRMDDDAGGLLKLSWPATGSPKKEASRQCLTAMFEGHNQWQNMGKPHLC